MKKTDFISDLFNNFELSKTDSKIAIETILGEIVKNIASGQGVEIRGFGSFHKKHRQPREGVNPKTGEKIQVGEKFVPFFKPGKELREIVNKSNF